MEVVSEHRNENGSATQYLFTYGTLQDESVQKAHLGRTLDGTKDTLACHKISELKIANAYPIIIPTEKEEDTITGICYVLTPDELLAIDFYEGQEYTRKQVRLASGKKAWVYLGKTKNSQEK
ncbi:gamma-glutamylcyclotransferase family protein [Maribacter halichondriae]|uniref:gamma-glutamylcyclotransferase family protein n=1 Tax=Maribacter halichondriae TaxID=2980554 RepID=UPI002359F0C4|nr:gamma-glutamylcyclotransferase family protein [Maribacter sp. Hal144]